MIDLTASPCKNFNTMHAAASNGLLNHRIEVRLETRSELHARRVDGDHRRGYSQYSRYATHSCSFPPPPRVWPDISPQLLVGTQFYDLVRRMMQRGVMRATQRGFSTTKAFCLRSHCWMERVSESRWRLGITDRGIEEIGDLVSVRPLLAAGESVEQQDGLMQIEWAGMMITDGDELYHTKWANVEGETTVRAPCSATVTAICEPLDRLENLCAEDWLVELELKEPTASLDDLVDEMQYLEAVAQAGPGPFGEGDDRLEYSSYG
jgi:glycine cleavage system H lipoate-binding protein